MWYILLLTNELQPIILALSKEEYRSRPWSAYDNTRYLLGSRGLKYYLILSEYYFKEIVFLFDLNAELNYNELWQNGWIS